MAVDRRRLRKGDSYTPNSRGPALAKQRAASYRYNKQYKPYRTEQSPGTQGVPYDPTLRGGFGGFKGGLFTQQMRNQNKQYDRERAESLRPETEIQQSILNKIKTAGYQD